MDGMDTATFEKFKHLIYEKSGITLRPGKEGLVAARIGSRMRETGIDTPRKYFDYVVADGDGTELILLLDAISTNVTSFFREENHFQFLENTLKKWQAAGQSKFRIWSAASSTGEEPYTISMVAHSTLMGTRGVDLRILATDISTRVLAECKRGMYDEGKIQPVPPAFKNRYLTKRTVENKVLYEVSDDLKRLVTFSRLNLSQPPFPMKGPFDIVFIRNVMIYFDQQVRMNLLKDVERLLKPGGYLILGHAESLSGLPLNFIAQKSSIYQKPGVHQ